MTPSVHVYLIFEFECIRCVCVLRVNFELLHIAAPCNLILFQLRAKGLDRTILAANRFLWIADPYSGSGYRHLYFPSRFAFHRLSLSLSLTSPSGLSPVAARSVNLFVTRTRLLERERELGRRAHRSVHAHDSSFNSNVPTSSPLDL